MGDSETFGTLVIGGGQAGIAMSEQLSRHGVSHVVLERARIAERWRTERWDSLVANGPAWHDRLPGQIFAETGPDGFAPRDEIVRYFERYAQTIAAPIRDHTTVTRLSRRADGQFVTETHSDAGAATLIARNVVVATGPFQHPVIPAIIPATDAVTQLHSAHYKAPAQLPDGGVLVIGAGSSGAQIADELHRAGRPTWLSVGPHHRPPRRYRDRDFVWWLGVLGKWDEPPAVTAEHVTISVSGAHGGQTVDFRDMARRGITLTGRATGYDGGTMRFAGDLPANLAAGDANYLATLREADYYVIRHGLDLPPEPAAHRIGADPACVTSPIVALDLAAAGISTVVWATGYRRHFGWIAIDAFDPAGEPRHRRGISAVPGLHFLGLPGLSRRASAFIWGVWHDAAYLADHIAAHDLSHSSAA